MPKFREKFPHHPFLLPLLLLWLIGLLLLISCAPTVTPSAESTQAGADEAEAASGPKSGGTLYIGQDFGPQSLDPHNNTAWASTNIYESIYNGLVKWNEDETALEPDLATEWEISDDSLVYTFTIRSGVKFHNGREMTADDVKFSIDRLRNPDTSIFAANYESLETVEVLDAQTVQITLSQPFATLLSFLTNVYPIVPEEAVDQLETQPVGTGPFMFDEYLLDQYVRLVRNPDY